MTPQTVAPVVDRDLPHVEMAQHLLQTLAIRLAAGEIVCFIPASLTVAEAQEAAGRATSLVVALARNEPGERL